MAQSEPIKIENTEEDDKGHGLALIMQVLLKTRKKSLCYRYFIYWFMMIILYGMTFIFL